MAWYRDIGEVVVPVTCGPGGATHTVRWRRGRLRLDHHDPDAEEALVAFGGERPRCLELLQLWRAAVRDGGFIEEWASRPRPDLHRTDWLEVALRRLRAEGVQDLLIGLPPARADRMGSVLVSFPLELQDRAALAVAVRTLRTTPPISDAALETSAGSAAPAAPAWPGWPAARARAQDPTHLHLHLAEAARQRARIAFVKSLRPLAAYARPAALVPLSCEIVEHACGLAPKVDGLLAGRDSWCRLTLPRSWLVDVWGRGVATVDGHFVASIDGQGRAHSGPLEATAVQWSPAGGGAAAGAVASLRAAVIERSDGGGWQLRWR